MNHEEAVLAKKNLRKQVKALVRDINSVEKESRSRTGCDLLLRGQAYKECDAVFSYMPLSDEVDVSLINNNAIQNKSIFILPRVINADSGVMKFYICNKGDRPLLKSENYGILEPEENPENELNLDVLQDKKVLVIVPGVAFSKDNFRMGRGKGFYDRSLSYLLKNSIKYGYQIKLTGICFREQLLEDIPVEQNDIMMDDVTVC